MLTLRQRIDTDMRTAMKSGDAARLGVLRLVKAKMLEAEVALRASKGRDYTLDDGEATRVLAACAKQRRDSIDSFRAGGREDLAAQEEAELTVIRGYLPEPVSSEEIERIAREVIDSVGAKSPRDIGAVMKVLMPRLKGAADGKEVNRIISGLLSGRS